MGMGYAACSTQAFKYDDVKELCPAEVAAIEAVEGFESWGALAQSLWCDNEEELAPFKPLVEALCNAFSKATEVDGKGLKLILTYYDEGSGDRYDEVEHLDGCMFEVEGVYQMTPAGNKFKDKLAFATYVVFG